jgi:SulP family sulfate permease
VGFGTIGVIAALRFAKQRFGWHLLPDLLLAVVLMGWLTAYLGLDQQGVRVVGEIPRRLPAFETPRVDLDLTRELANGALAIAVLGLLEAISMAKAIAATWAEARRTSNVRRASRTSRAASSAASPARAR